MIAEQHPSSSAVANLNGSEPFFTSDEYLKPSLEDDPLLRECKWSESVHSQVPYRFKTEIEPDDWSDSDEEVDQGNIEEPKDLSAANRQIKALQRNLQQAKQDLVYYRQFVSERLNLAGVTDELQKGEGPSGSKDAAPPRDDDSHYFQSYAENGRHIATHRTTYLHAARYSFRHDQRQGPNRIVREVYLGEPRGIP